MPFTASQIVMLSLLVAIFMLTILVIVGIIVFINVQTMSNYDEYILEGELLDYDEIYWYCS